MPRVMPIWRADPIALLEKGRKRVSDFCLANEVPCPGTEEQDRWFFDACAYYRPQTIKICLKKCARLDNPSPRNWNWPGSTTDREPYGVLAHELGHHCDRLAGEVKHSYFSDYSLSLSEKSGEPAITSYCPNQAEWFAEIFRLFVTNGALLKLIRPKTYKLLAQRWIPVSHEDWEWELGDNVPERILTNLQNKVCKAKRGVYA